MKKNSKLLSDPKKQKKAVSIVISAFNEEGNIGQLYSELSTLTAQLAYTFEFIFVDDGSSDSTNELIHKLVEKDSSVKCVELVRNFGHEIAMTAGMDHAMGDCVIFMDADLQHPPKLIPLMIAEWEKGNEVVLTERLENKDSSYFHKFITGIYYRLLNTVSDVDIPSNTPDFRLISRRYVEVLKMMDEQERMFRGMINWIGVRKISKIPFIAEKRHAGESKYSYSKLFKLGINALIQFSVKPLRMATYIGVIAALLSVVLGIFTLWEYFTKNPPQTGYTTTIIIIIFIGSIQLMVLGIIGEYIGRVHMEVKRRPLYVADFIVNTKRKKR